MTNVYDYAIIKNKYVEKLSVNERVGKTMIKALKDYRFLLSRLIKRDFIQKYKKTALGIIWSVMNPLCELMILMLVFKNIFGRDTPYYTTYVIIGILTFNYYTNATTQGMGSLLYK